MRARAVSAHGAGAVCAAVQRLEGRVLLSGGFEPACPAPQELLDSQAAVQSASLWDGPVVLAPNGLPILNSLPGAPTAIYLDFDGDTGEGIEAYDVDGDPGTFNSAEQQTITEAWRQMSVYFAMFDTNVTTQKPSVPMVYNIIGNNTGGSTGGWAWVGTFPNTTPNAFNNSSHARGRVTGMAHEVGHVFGLSHQSTYDLLGNKTAEYAGQLDSLHGQLMGVDYAGDVHKWTIGHPSGSASDLQDDMAVIAGRIKPYQKPVGDGYRKDDYPGSTGSATALAWTQGGQSVTGIIERLNDADAFSFVAEGGAVQISAVPDWPSGVDLKLAVYDGEGNLLAAKDGDTNDQQITMSLGAGTYYAIVTSHGNYGDVGVYKLSVRALPEGWISQDIGTTNQVGYAQYDPAAEVYTVGGSGSDLDGTTDHFHFAYQQLSGDGQIVARVQSMGDSNPMAKAGLMIRERLTNNSKSVMLAATWGNGLQAVWRASTGGSSSEYHGSAQAFAPIYLKLERQGSQFRAYTSEDGVGYTLWRTVTVSMTATVYIGLAVCAYDQSQLNVATFSEVSVSGNLGQALPVYNSLPAPGNLVVSLGAGTGLELAWDAVAGATGYAVQRSADGVTFSQVGTTAAEVTTYSDGNLAGSMRYFYRVSALDGEGASAPSGTAHGVNRPSPPTNLAITSLNMTTLVLNWRDTDGESGYRIERSTDGTSFTLRGTVGANIPSWTDKNLVAGTTYYYRVAPTSGMGVGPATASATGTTRLPAVAGLTFDSVASNRIVFHWLDLAGETGYRVERSLDGTTFTTVATLGQDVTSYTDSGVQPLKEYYYRVVGLKAGSESMTATAAFVATPATTELRDPWSARDIGATGGGGASGYAGGVYTVIGGGNEIGGSADAFRFTYQPLIGDGEITARVTKVEATDDWARVGVMIRDSLNANARNVLVTITSGNGARMQYRRTTGGTTTNVAGPSDAAAPYFVRLVRSGSTFTGYVSSSGTAGSWVQVGSVTMSLAAVSYIGLAVSAGTTGTLNTSTFDRVTITNQAPTLATQPSASPEVVGGTTTELSVLGADDHGEQYLTYTWSATGLPAGAAEPTFSVNASNAAKTTTATFHQAGQYTFTVIISDSSGQFVSGEVVVTVGQTLTLMAVVPDGVEVRGGATQQFSVLATDQFNRPMQMPPAVVWSIISGGGSIDEAGLFTAPASAQTTTIQATAGALSATATATTVVTVPVGPTGITGERLAEGGLRIQWIDNADNEEGYRIERSPDGVGFVPAGTVGADGTSFVDADPPVGIAVYRVLAYAGDVASEDGAWLALISGDGGADAFAVRLDGPGSLRLAWNTEQRLVPSGLVNQVLVWGGGGDVLTVDLSDGGPAPAGGILFDAPGDAVLEVAGASGTLHVSAMQVTHGSAAIGYGGAQVRLSPAMELTLLALSGGAVVQLGGDGALMAANLSIAEASSLDLSDGALILRATPESRDSLVQQVIGYVRSGQLLSSSAFAYTTLAVSPNDNGTGSPLTNELAGVAVGVNDILVKLTYKGDANFDGVVNADDYFQIDQGYISQKRGWYNGDFNNDQAINADDYFLIDQAYIGQGAALGAGTRQSAYVELFSGEGIDELV